MNGFNLAVRQIAVAVFCDSGVDGIGERIRTALSSDLAAGAPLPNYETIGLIVMGDDEGEFPPEVTNTYSNLHALLNEVCT